MAYIVVLNPLILGTASRTTDGGFLGGGVRRCLHRPTSGHRGGHGPRRRGLMTILMGVFANFPLALATGLGLNAFVAFGHRSRKMTWADAMGLVVLEGIIILVLVLTGFRQAVFHAVPAQLKIAISVGIGLFIAIIGLVDAGFVRRTGRAGARRARHGGTLHQRLADLRLRLGLVLVVGLWVRKVKGAILIAIVATTVLAIIVEAVAKIGPTVIGQNPDGRQGQPDSAGTSTSRRCRRRSSTRPTWPRSVSSTSSARSASAGWSRRPAHLHPHARRLLRHHGHDDRDRRRGRACSTRRAPRPTPRRSSSSTPSLPPPVAPPGSRRTRPTSSRPRASARVPAPAWRRSSPVVLFLLSMVFAPLVKIIPYEAAVPALVLVGFLMMQQVKEIDWDDLEIAIPAFLTIVLMPFTYSITAGIGAGFVAYVLIKLVRGKAGRSTRSCGWSRRSSSSTSPSTRSSGSSAPAEGRPRRFVFSAQSRRFSKVVHLLLEPRSRGVPLLIR
jgi:AGZA family xanthine/uracil permease-like MFS transporter